MKLIKVKSLKALFAAAALFGACAANAAQAVTDQAPEGSKNAASHSSRASWEVDDIQPPAIPNGIEVVTLPHATSVGRVHTNCFAAYLIEKFGPRTVRLHPDTDHENGNDHKTDQSPDRNEITYHFRVTNVGSCFLTHLRVADFFPRHTDFKRAFPWPDIVDDDHAVWFIPWLDVGDRIHFDITFRVFDNDSHDNVTHDIDDFITNTACVKNWMVWREACAFASSHLGEEEIHSPLQ